MGALSAFRSPQGRNIQAMVSMLKQHGGYDGKSSCDRAKWVF